MWDDSDSDGDGNNEPVEQVPYVPPPSSNPWEGEDEEEEVGGAWDADSEDEEETKKKKETEKKESKESKNKKLSKKEILRKKEETERKEQLARARLKLIEENMTEEQKAARAARMQAERERAELRVTGDLFGERNDEDDFLAPDPIADLNHPAYAPVIIQAEEAKLENKADHEAYGVEIAKKLIDRHSSPANMSAFTKSLISTITANMTLEQVNVIKQAVTVVHKQKLKDRSNNSKKKKKGNQLKVGASSMYDDYNTNGADFDFI